MTKRSGLLGLVIGAHIGVGLIIVAAKTVAPIVQEMPLMVEFLPVEAPKPEISPPKPKPEPKSQPTPAPKTPAPKLETTSATTPAPNAPVAPPVETKAPPAPPVPVVAEPVVTQPRFDADYLSNPKPNYPPISHRMGEEGKVILRVQVSPQGSAETVEIKTSSGSVRLDEAALKTVRTWKFVPAKKGDTPVSAWVLVPIIFKLEQ